LNNYKQLVQTVCYCLKPKENLVLLGLKKDRYGKGFWVGFGGHWEPDESIRDCCLREVKQESGLLLKKVFRNGIINIVNHQFKSEIDLYVFSSENFSGEPKANLKEILQCKWFPYDSLPPNMWANDNTLLPWLFTGETFVGTTVYAHDGRLVQNNIIKI